MNTKGIFSHDTDNWRTPKKIFNVFMEKGFIDCFKFMDQENELEKNYFNSRLFVNPPYSKLGGVVDWLLQQATQKNEIWLLLPVRTDTKYFKKLVVGVGFKMSIIFISGRLKFNEAKNSAPFPSMFIVISEKITQPQTFTVMTEEDFIKDITEYL